MMKNRSQSAPSSRADTLGESRNPKSKSDGSDLYYNEPSFIFQLADGTHLKEPELQIPVIDISPDHSLASENFKKNLTVAAPKKIRAQSSLPRAKYAHVQSRIAKYIKGDCEAFETKSRPVSAKSTVGTSFLCSQTTDPELREILNSLIPNLNPKIIEDDKSDDSYSSSETSVSEEFDSRKFPKIPVVKLGQDDQSPISIPVLNINQRFTHVKSYIKSNKSRPTTSMGVRSKTFEYPSIPSNASSRPKSSPAFLSNAVELEIRVPSVTNIHELRVQLQNDPAATIIQQAETSSAELELVKIVQPKSIYPRRIRPNSAGSSVRVDLQAELEVVSIPSRPTSALKVSNDLFQHETISQGDSISFSAIGPWTNPRSMPKQSKKEATKEAIDLRILELSKPRTLVPKYRHESIREKMPAKIKVFPLCALPNSAQRVDPVLSNKLTGKLKLDHETYFSKKQVDFAALPEKMKKFNRKPMYIIEEATEHAVWSGTNNRPPSAKIDNKEIGNNPTRCFEKRVSFSDQCKIEYLNEYGGIEKKPEFEFVQVVTHMSEPKIQINRVGW